jgi:hypothetical protein
MASTQSHLPIEIWDQIISYLPHQYDRADGFALARGPAQPSPDNANLETMYNLRLINKALFAVVRRHLYTEFMHFKPWPRRDLRKCLINILKEPSLGSQLKVICYQTENVDQSACQFSAEMHEPLLIDSAREYSQEIESILIERARGFAGLHFPDGDGHEIPFLEHIRRRCAAAQLVLLLHAAPNLDILNPTSLDWDPCAQLLGMIHASNSLPNFPPL